jgi:hypothetical protein
MLAPAFREIDHVDPDLTLDGLRFIWERNRRGASWTGVGGGSTGG